ncbi:MAG: flippase-like domain-containing protein [Sphingobacteriales bacterium]|nr:MAG: flippase-like domain-containing protein [Sphingobacteriales bacterium]
MNLNKSTKIWINYGIGAVLACILLWSIWNDVKVQLAQSEGGWDNYSWQSADIYIAVFLLPVNVMLEGYKWHLLVSEVQPASYGSSLKSVLVGIALSILTPNRIGEYPGRILYLRKNKTIRLIGVSVLGALSQFITLFIFGCIGLAYYTMHFSNAYDIIVLSLASCVLLALLALFFFQKRLLKYLSSLKWPRRMPVYIYLIKKISTRQQFQIVGLSMLRYLVFTAQYIILLHWIGITFSLGLVFLSFLFFWAMAVIPSFALAELGIRGKLSLFLFLHLTTDTIGVLTATLGLWCINLIIPAIAGSILTFKMRLIR